MYIYGIMGVLRKTEWTEKKIQDKLKMYFMSPNTKKYEITNLYVYGWESDYLAITKSMIAYEVEIKISRPDFKNDFKNKQDGSMIGKFPKGSSMPNYFYYAVPDGLIGADEVPDYAGLLYVQPWGITFVKQPKKLTDEKFDPVKLYLADKFYYNMLSWKDKYEKLSGYADEIKQLKKYVVFNPLRLSRLLKDSNYNDEISESVKQYVENNPDIIKNIKKHISR